MSLSRPLDEAGQDAGDILAGRRLLTFFFFSLLGSWLDMESVWVTCSVCDMVYGMNRLRGGGDGVCIALSCHLHLAPEGSAMKHGR